MQRPNLVFAIIAGMLAASATAVVWYLAPVIGLPLLDMPSLLGSWVTGRLSDAFVPGLLLHFLLGMLLGCLYVYLFASALRGNIWLRGLQFSLLPLLLTIAVFLPLVSAYHPLVRLHRLPAPGPLGYNWGAAVPPLLIIGLLVYGVAMAVLYAFLTTALSFVFEAPPPGDDSQPQ